MLSSASEDKNCYVLNDYHILLEMQKRDWRGAIACKKRKSYALTKDSL